MQISQFVSALSAFHPLLSGTPSHSPLEKLLSSEHSSATKNHFTFISLSPNLDYLATTHVSAAAAAAATK